MRKFLSYILLIAVLQACIVAQTKRLADCDFNFKEVTKLHANGVDVLRVKSLSELNLAENVTLSKGVLQNKMAISTNVLLDVKNNSNGKAALNAVEWILLLKNKEVVRGNTDQKLALEAGETGVLPLNFTFDLFKVLAESNMSDLLALAEDPFNSGALTIKIKPSFTIAGKQVKYPSYINVKY